MAIIVGGIAASHGPLLSVSPALWHLRAGADRKNGAHWFRGQSHDYASLLAHRQPGFDSKVEVSHQQVAHGDCQRALDRLAQRFDDFRADYAVIVGNDQREVFGAELTPSLLVYTGATVENIPLTPERRAMLPPGIAEAEDGHCPPEGARYQGLPDEANALAGLLADQGFDIATSASLPRHVERQEGVPHAFGFIYRRIMRDQPPHTIPIFVNVGVPPNQVRVPRALQFGRALAQALRGLPGDARVVLIASGGLSHFVVDEALDLQVMAALDPLDTKAIESIPETHFQGNTAEIKSWLVVAAAMQTAGLHVEHADYTPCYRTPAGTGSGMGFVAWS